MVLCRKSNRCLRLQGTVFNVGFVFELSLPNTLSMKQIYRLVATAVYLFFMATTLLLAFYPEYIPLRVMWLLISIFFQFVALVWYNLSYIPFAREIMKNMCQTMCCKDCAQSTVRVLFFIVFTNLCLHNLNSQSLFSF